LNDVTLHVAAGECLAVSAANLALASVFMRVVATLHQPDSGALSIDGIDAIRNPFRARQRLTYAGPVTLAARPGMRLRDAWSTVMAGRSTATTATRGTFLDQCGFDLSASIDSLSPVRQKCAAIAMALDSHAPLALLDLPFDGLDDEAAAQVESWISSARQGGAALVVTVGRSTRTSWASRTAHLES
jgi:ABC-2 type transport system ATP-binding protein